MRLTFLLTGMLALGPIADVYALKQGPDSQLQLEILARKFDAGGQSSAAAGDRDMSNSQTWVFTTPDLCGMGASDNQPASSAYVQWRVNGRVLNTTTGPAGQQLAVQIEWERLWDGGQKLQNGPKGSHTVTLNAGNSLVLDRVVPTGSSSCKVAEVRLEASAVYRTTGTGRGGRGGVATGVTGGVAAGVGGGTTTTIGRGRAGAPAGGSPATTTMSGEGRGGGRGTATGGSGSGGSTTTVTRSGGAGGGRGGAAQTPDGRYRILAEMYGVGLQGMGQHTAELWLVHKQPNGPELVQQQTIRFGVKGTDYSFPPVPITTSRGVVTIDITGSLAVPLTGFSRYFLKESKAAATQGRGRGAGSGSASASAAASSTAEPAQPAPDQKPQVIVALSRRARAGGPEALDTSGSTSMSIAIPAPEEVLSFEFPALQKATEDLLSGHKFSIRLRITPVK